MINCSCCETLKAHAKPLRRKGMKEKILASLATLRANYLFLQQKLTGVLFSSQWEAAMSNQGPNTNDAERRTLYRKWFELLTEHLNGLA